jgi:hypothetical protein
MTHAPFHRTVPPLYIQRHKAFLFSSKNEDEKLKAEDLQVQLEDGSIFIDENTSTKGIQNKAASAMLKQGIDTVMDPKQSNLFTVGRQLTLAYLI